MAYGVFVHTVLPRDLIYRCVLVYTRAAGALCQQERVYKQTSTLRDNKLQKERKKERERRVSKVKRQENGNEPTRTCLRIRDQSPRLSHSCLS